MEVDQLDRRIEVGRYAKLILEAMKNWITIFDYEDALKTIPQSAKMELFNTRKYERVCYEISRNKQITWVCCIKYDKKKDMFKWMTKACDEPKQCDICRSLFTIIDTIVLHKVDKVFLDRLRRLAE